MALPSTAPNVATGLDPSPRSLNGWRVRHSEGKVQQHELRLRRHDRRRMGVGGLLYKGEEDERDGVDVMVAGSCVGIYVGKGAR